MIAYKKYCSRRAAQKGQETEETHCCPTRMPIIGPILFSLFIFTPYFLPSSDPGQTQNPVGKESLQINERTLQESNEDREDLQNLSSQKALQSVHPNH